MTIKIIAGKRYNTETATRVADWSNNYPRSDFNYQAGAQEAGKMSVSREEAMIAIELSRMSDEEREEFKSFILAIKHLEEIHSVPIDSVETLARLGISRAEVAAQMALTKSDVDLSLDCHQKAVTAEKRK